MDNTIYSRGEGHYHPGSMHGDCVIYKISFFFICSATAGGEEGCEITTNANLSSDEAAEMSSRLIIFKHCP